MLKNCIFCFLFYGNPMGMLWESYGADSKLIAKCACKGTTNNRDMQIFM